MRTTFAIGLNRDGFFKFLLGDLTEKDENMTKRKKIEEKASKMKKMR
jgi:hypothetical protein